jgi:hypothetical protein
MRVLILLFLLSSLAAFCRKSKYQILFAVNLNFMFQMVFVCQVISIKKIAIHARAFQMVCSMLVLAWLVIMAQYTPTQFSRNTNVRQKNLFTPKKKWTIQNSNAHHHNHSKSVATNAGVLPMENVRASVQKILANQSKTKHQNLKH